MQEITKIIGKENKVSAMPSQNKRYEQQQQQQRHRRRQRQHQHHHHAQEVPGSYIDATILYRLKYYA